MGLRSVFFTRGLYAATAALVVVGLALLLTPSAGRLEAGVAADSSSVAASPVASKAADTGTTSGDTAPAEANNPASASLPGEFQVVVISNIFSPERATPRQRYRPRGGTSGPEETLAPAPARAARRSPRLYGVTLHASGAVALIEADPAVPGAEIYRIGDPIAGGRLAEIGPASVVIARSTGRQVIRLEIESSSRERPPADPPRDTLRDKQQ